MEELDDPRRLADAYNLLIGQPGLGLEDFAERLGCPPEAARAILSRLGDLGLLSRYGAGNDALVALGPLTAMRQLLVRERDILRQRQEFLEESVSTYSTILSAYGTGPATADAQERTELLPDASAVFARLLELTAAARSEVLTFDSAPAPSGAAPAVGRALGLDPLDPGTRVRTVYPEAVLFDEDWLGRARAAAGAGAEVRLVPDLPLSMTLVDGHTAVLTHDPSGTGGGLIVRQPAVLLALTSLFETRWQQGRRLESTRREDGRTPAELAVLRALATGAKDDAVARQLGTSVRTVRRIVHALMEQAGTGSRFEFGAYAASRGWV
ncbi:MULTISPECIES: helix-turn-helix transcriptional regulator [unclassified Streptomyces]|uniref:helix-turn-helix transcriptional regulator n=1 Tax=unclassified Streptomyces TaxID=2593676 RepID=UPI000BE2597F|nr:MULTISPECIES: helix-turn-helix domain-containing protein [unclassified Streptomyces]